jgi:DNA-binding transcriptional ArsR family regulator
MKTKDTPSFEIDTNTLRKAALLYRSVNHPLRQQLLHLLHKNERMTVSRIYAKLRIEQSVASQHLAILRKAGMVVNEREGKNVFYSVNYERLQKFKAISAKLLTSKK